MRVGVLSDSHDRLDRVRLAVELLCAEGADVLVHCGDLTGPPVVAACAVRPFYFVFGNHDADNVPALRAAAAETGAACLGWGGQVTLAGKRVAVVHGHLRTDLRRLMEAGPDYLLSGHSHSAADFRDGPTRRVNPGALFRAEVFSVAIIDLGTDMVRVLTVSSPPDDVR